MSVQSESHVIDLMAPIFNEPMNCKGFFALVSRKMFQRPLSTESESIDTLRAPRDYFTLPNIDLTNERVQSFMDRPSHLDLLSIANRWIKKYPKKLDDLSRRNELGEVAKLTLSAPHISGAWQ